MVHLSQLPHLHCAAHLLLFLFPFFLQNPLKRRISVQSLTNFQRFQELILSRAMMSVGETGCPDRTSRSEQGVNANINCTEKSQNINVYARHRVSRQTWTTKISQNDNSYRLQDVHANIDHWNITK